MALETLAAGLVISVKNQTHRGISAIGKGLKGLKGAGAKVGQAMSALTPLVTGLTAAGAGLGLILAAGTKQAIAFEEQMSAVRAISSGSAEDFSKLEKEIKRLGATSKFSATEAAKGAEALQRAGFNTQETIKGLGAVLSVAAAEGMEDLGLAASIVSSSVRAFGLDASQASLVADTLAQTSAKTNTTMVTLSESMKLVGAKAKVLGISIGDTAAAVGILGDSGIKGTMAGTALKNMLAKLTAPSKKATKFMKEYGLKLEKTKDGSVDLVKTMNNFNAVLSKIPDKGEKAAVAAELFGERGQSAFFALASAADKNGGDLQKRFDEIQKGTKGAAERMAAIRMDNVAGGFKQLESAIEALSIEALTGNLGGLKDMLMFSADAIRLVVAGIKAWKGDTEGAAEQMDAFDKKWGGLADTIFSFGQGLQKGLDVIREGMKVVSSFSKTLMKSFGGGGDIAMIAGMIVAIGTPILIVFAAVAAAAAAIIIPIVMFGEVIFGVLAAVGVALAVVAAGFVAFGVFVQGTRKEGESFGESLMRTFGNIRAFAEQFFAGFRAGYELHIRPTFEQFKAAGVALWAAIQPVFTVIGDAFGGMSADGTTTGMRVAQAFGMIASAIAWTAENVIAPFISFWADNFVIGILTGVTDILGGLFSLVTGSETVGASMLRIFAGVGKSFGAVVLLPIKMALETAIKVAKALGAGDNAAVSQAEDALKMLQFKEGAAKAGGIGVTAKASGVGATGQPKIGGSGSFGKPAAASAAKSNVNVNIENKPADNKIDIKNDLHVDGKSMSSATSKSQIEQLERLGGVQSPFFNKAVKTNGGITNPAGR